MLEGEEGPLLLLGATGMMRQEEYPGDTIIGYARNELNKLRCLAMLWTVCHILAEGAQFAFNFYNYWVQLLLRHPIKALFILLIIEGVTDGNLLSRVLFSITLTPLVEDI